MDFDNGPKITRRKGACLNCKHRKIRCDGNSTCSHCLKSNLVCSYTKPSTGNVSRRKSATISRANTTRSSGQGVITQDETKKHQDLVDRSSQPASSSYLDTSRYVQSHSGNPNLEPDFDPFDIYGDAASNQSSLALQRDNEMSSPSRLSVIRHQSLDHGVSYGVDQDWSRVWAEDLCHDFSSLSPLRFLSSHVEDTQMKNFLSTVSSQHFTPNLQYSKKFEESFTSYDLSKSLSPYASEETTHILNACFEFEYAPSLYLSRELIEETLADLIFSPKDVNTYASALVDGVLANGCRILAMNSKTTLGATNSSIARASELAYFHRALRKIREENIGDPPIMIKIQSLVTLVLYAKNHQDVFVTRSLLFQAIYTIQNFISLLPKAPSTTEEIKRQESIECMFWLLYSVDMQFMIRFGGHPTISDDLVMYRAPSRTTNSILRPASEQSRWQLVHYRYARLCSVIVRIMYSNAAVAMTPSETASSVRYLSKILEAWRISIPAADRPPAIPEFGKFPRESCVQLDWLLKYVEAAFAIHRWSMILPIPSGPSDVLEVYSISQKHCIDLAKGILDLTNTFRTHDAEIDWPNIHLPLLSAVFVFMAITKNEVGEDHLPYLGMASGYFARLTTSNSVSLELFNGVSHLVRIANFELKKIKDAGHLLGKSAKSKPAQSEATPLEQTCTVQSPTAVLDSFDFSGDDFNDSFDFSDPSCQFFYDQDFTINFG